MDVVSSSGCRFIGDILYHTEDCACDDDYQESVDNALSWGDDDN